MVKSNQIQSCIEGNMRIPYATLIPFSGAIENDELNCHISAAKGLTIELLQIFPNIRKKIVTKALPAQGENS